MTKLPFLAVVMLAALAAAVVGSAIFVGVNDVMTPWRLIAVIVMGGLPISLALAGLAGPTLGRVIIGDKPLDWAGAGLLGVAVAVLPVVVILVAVVPLRDYVGEPMELRGWLGGLVVFAVAGCVGGLTFRWFHGGGRIR